MANFTQAELSALRRAYATGALKVTYDGQTVEYGSRRDLEARIARIEQDLGTRKRSHRTVFGTSDGTR